MPRYAVVDNGVVVGVLGASAPPTIDVPFGRLYIDTKDLPDIRGGEHYDPATGIFSLPDAALLDRVASIEADVQVLKDQAAVARATSVVTVTPP